MAGWSDGSAVLAGKAPYRPEAVVLSPSPLLPPNERRRTVPNVRLALAVGSEALADAGRDAAATAAVFASSGGDGATIHAMLSALASDERELSPTRFHNSVHNAPAGYWSIATGSREPTSSLCCYDASFAAGLLEAAVQATIDRRAVALIAYDLPYPEPLNAARPIGAVFGVALVLTPEADDRTRATLDIAIVYGAPEANRMADAALEQLRLGTPAARSLPLLAAMAVRTGGEAILEYLSGTRLCVAVSPGPDTR
jgi:hypothetical protein